MICKVIHYLPFRIQNWIDHVTAVPGADAELGSFDFVNYLLVDFISDHKVRAAAIAAILL